jgi:hypothetical protein
MIGKLLAFRGITVSHEIIRKWALKFGQGFANRIRRCLPRAGDKTVCLLWQEEVVRLAVCNSRGLPGLDRAFPHAQETDHGPDYDLTGWTYTKPL